METGKFFFIITLVCAVVGVFSAIHHFQAVDAANALLIESKTKLSQQKDTLAVRQGEWAKIEAVAGKVREAASKEAPLAKELDELKARFRRAEGDFKYMVSSIRSSVDKARAAAVGTEYPEVQLTTGKTLKAAKIKKMDAMNISFIHADGFTIVPYDELPAEIRERFDMGGNGLAEQLAAAEQSIQTAKYSPVAGSSSSFRSSRDNFGSPGLQTIEGLTINCPIPLSRGASPPTAPGLVNTQVFGGKDSIKEIEIAVLVLDAPTGKKPDMEAGIKGAFDAVIKMGVSKPSSSTLDLSVSGHPAKKSSFSGIGGGQPFFLEALCVQKDERLFMIQCSFSGKDPKNRDVVSAILASAKVE